MCVISLVSIHSARSALWMYSDVHLAYPASRIAGVRPRAITHVSTQWKADRPQRSMSMPTWKNAHAISFGLQWHAAPGVLGMLMSQLGLPDSTVAPVGGSRTLVMVRSVSLSLCNADLTSVGGRTCPKARAVAQARRACGQPRWPVVMPWQPHACVWVDTLRQGHSARACSRRRRPENAAGLAGQPDSRQWRGDMAARSDHIGWARLLPLTVDAIV